MKKSKRQVQRERIRELRRRPPQTLSVSELAEVHYADLVHRKYAIELEICVKTKAKGSVLKKYSNKLDSDIRKLEKKRITLSLFCGEMEGLLLRAKRVLKMNDLSDKHEPSSSFVEFAYRIADDKALREQLGRESSLHNLAAQKVERDWTSTPHEFTIDDLDFLLLNSDTMDELNESKNNQSG